MIKKNLEEINDEDVLKGLLKLRIFRFQYKPFTRIDGGEDHMGPLAEDFQAIFGVGDGKTIQFVDFCGVVLASLKALAKGLEDLNGRSR